MDHPNPSVTWEVDAVGLSAVRSKALRSAVATAGHCLQLWSDFLAAATPHRLRIVVAVTDDPDAEPVPAARFDGGQDRVDILVPHHLLQEKASQLAALLLESVIPAVVETAERHPHPEPAVVWQSTAQLSYEPPEPVGTDDDSAFGLELETLDEDQLLLIGRLDDTPNDEHTRRQVIDDYVSPRLDGVGFEVQSDTFTTCSFVYWIVDLPGASQD